MGLQNELNNGPRPTMSPTGSRSPSTKAAPVKSTGKDMTGFSPFARPSLTQIVTPKQTHIGAYLQKFNISDNAEKESSVESDASSGPQESAHATRRRLVSEWQLRPHSHCSRSQQRRSGRETLICSLGVRIYTSSNFNING